MQLTKEQRSELKQKLIQPFEKMMDTLLNGIDMMLKSIPENTPQEQIDTLLNIYTESTKNNMANYIQALSDSYKAAIKDVEALTKKKEGSDE